MRVGLVGRERELSEAYDAVVGDGVGVLLVGEPGVGKTRLLDELLDRVGGDGWHIERFVATDATRLIPLGALLSLLPAASDDTVQLVAGVRRELLALAGDRPMAVAVDDAHLLDPVALVCIADLTHHSDVHVVATARTTEPMPVALTDLWVSDRVRRIAVDQLDRDATAELTARLLTGDVSERLGHEVWVQTRGVPLLVRELLLDALAGDRVRRAGRRWDVAGDLRSGDRLQELVRARLARVKPSLARLAELTAVAEPLPVELLDADEQALLDGLVDARLAKVERSAGRLTVRSEHPLVADAIAASVSRVARAHHLRQVKERLVAAGCPVPGDSSRVARWCDELGEPLDDEIAVRAGREAMRSLDLDRAAELASRVIDRRPLDGHLLRGETLRLQADAVAAEQELQMAAGLAVDDEVIVRVAMWRSTLRAHHLDDPQGALDLLNAAADAVVEPLRALELRSEAAFLAGLLGQWPAAVTVNRNILGTEGIDEPTRWTALMNLVFAQVMLADLTGIDGPIAEMEAMTERAGQVRPEGIDLYWGLRAAVMTLRGQFDLIEDELVAWVRRSVATDQIHGIAAAIVATAPLALRGSAYTGEVAAAAVASFAVSDAYLSAPIGHSVNTLVWAAAGDVEQANAAHALVDDTHHADLRLVGLVGRAEAALTALGGRHERAAAIVAAAGRRCLDGAFVYMGTVTSYDAVRFGHGDLVADDLVTAAQRCNAPLVQLMADHAVAQRDADAAGLDRVAARLAECGAWALGADAFADAASVHVAPEAAARSAAMAVLWQRAATPNALARPVRAGLSDRELDVVAAALTGETSRVIAERLYVSVRTVDNHLAHAYRKLGVASRDELAQVLTPSPAQPMRS